MPEKGTKIEETNAVLESELTETATEGEVEYDETCRENFVSRSSQSNFEIPCEHRFSLTVLRDLARGRDSEEKYFIQLTLLITGSGSMVAPLGLCHCCGTVVQLICWDFHDSQHTPMIK